MRRGVHGIRCTNSGKADPGKRSAIAAAPGNPYPLFVRLFFQLATPSSLTPWTDSLVTLPTSDPPGLLPASRVVNWREKKKPELWAPKQRPLWRKIRDQEWIFETKLKKVSKRFNPWKLRPNLTASFFLPSFLPLMPLQLPSQAPSRFLLQNFLLNRKSL